MKKKIILITFFILIFLSILCFCFVFLKTSDSKDDLYVKKSDYSFDSKMILQVNKYYDNNYIISPYSINVALNMLKDGTVGTTRQEINSVISDYSVVPGLDSANSVFINPDYKNLVLKKYLSIVQEKYKGEIFDSIDVKKINDWVFQKTNKMIPKMFDSSLDDSLVVLINALAIDAKWKKQFECNYTSEETFKKDSGEIINVSMMHQSLKSGDAFYIDTDDELGIVLPYKKSSKDGLNLEFIGLLPKDTSINDYVDSFTDSKIKNIFQNYKKISDDNRIYLSLPMFKNDFEFDKIMPSLQKLGMKKVFSPGDELSSMIKCDDCYVSDIVHKSSIDLSESGTKAAASTAVVISKNSIDGYSDQMEINFNKPFSYMIRDKNTGTIIFFGVVYEPNLWNGSTCK